MAYKLKLKAEVLVFNAEEKKYDRKSTTIDFKFHTASSLTGLVREMATYADDPLDFTISREDE